MEFRALNTQYKKLKTQIDAAVLQVMASGKFIHGPEVTELERQLASYVGVEYSISCANGTDALSLVLTAWGIGEGDAVFVPDFTFFATAEVVASTGATPVFVDVDSNTFNMSPSSLLTAIEHVIAEGILTPKVIIPVDLFGLPADYDAIESIAATCRLKVLEDGAQGFGGIYRKRTACSFGSAATTSFFPAKPLGCYGDGGAIFTSDEKLKETLQSLRVHGKGSDKYDNVRIGVNSRLDTIQAAILLEKLKAFQDYELNEVNRAALTYNTQLEGIDGIDIPEIPEGYVSSWAQYTIRVRDSHIRETLMKVMKREGIPSMIYYPKPLHRQSAFTGKTQYVPTPVTERLCETVLSLPMHPYLEDTEIVKICEAVKGAVV